MSHFTTIQTRLAELEFLKLGLADLGYQWRDARDGVLGYLGNRTPADIKVSTSNPEYEIGFRKVGETFECVADWDQIRGVRQEDFLKQLSQRYAYHAARVKLEAQGFALAREEVDRDGRIHLVLRRTN